MLEGLRLDFDPIPWFDATKLTCDAGTSISWINFGLKEAGSQLAASGLYDSTLG